MSLTAKPGSPAEAPTSFAEGGVPPVSTELRGFVTRQFVGTDIVFVTIASASDTCESVTAKAPPAKGTQRVEVRTQWLSGYYDFSNKMADAKFQTYTGAIWSKEGASKGGVQVRAAPTTPGGTGRIHVKASRAGSGPSLDAEIDVTLCPGLDFTKKVKK
jgi:hypothetical protein